MGGCLCRVYNEKLLSHFHFQQNPKIIILKQNKLIQLWKKMYLVKKVGFVLFIYLNFCHHWESTILHKSIIQSYDSLMSHLKKENTPLI